MVVPTPTGESLQDLVVTSHCDFTAEPMPPITTPIQMAKCAVMANTMHRPPWGAANTAGLFRRIATCLSEAKFAAP